ncbi:MAG: TetR/AcrR family transcriptional regulator [Geodermatophilaceae bacterium]|nr:TetR/AcrR family transcriptional regulator [Geodermatophilaceae bacterium]
MTIERALLPASTQRGRGTRQALLDAARAVFERDGYLEARITDIAAEAGVAYGTFYAHFRSKPEVFSAVMADLWSRLVVPAPAADGTVTPYERVLASNRHFLAGYRDNARLFAVVEQAATSLEEIQELRKRIHTDNADRVAKAIRRWRRDGIAAPDVHPGDAATALICMIGRSAYYWYVVEGRRTTRSEAETLTRLWLRGLGIAVPENRKR